MKRVLKIIAMLALLAGLYVAGVIVYGTVTDYSPSDLVQITPIGEAKTKADSIFTFITWNIGYTGQGARADFFYDGGKQVIASAADVAAYRDGITQFLSSQSDVDVFFFKKLTVWPGGVITSINPNIFWLTCPITSMPLRPITVCSLCRCL